MSALPARFWVDARGAGEAWRPGAEAGALAGALLDAPRDPVFSRRARTAADALVGVYRESGGAEGYAAIPLPPEAAGLAERVAAEAEAMFADCGRPNLMPVLRSGPEGLKALEALAARGVPVLLYGVAAPARADAAWEAYLRGLERLGDRLERSALTVVVPVAALDAALDPLLMGRMAAAPIDTIRAAYRVLVGRVGASTAKVICWRLRRAFDSARFALLEARGARRPQLAFAVGGRAAESFAELAGEGCRPLVTPEAAAGLTGARFGEAVVAEIDEAKHKLDKLANYQLDLDRIAEELELEGIAQAAGVPVPPPPPGRPR